MTKASTLTRVRQSSALLATSPMMALGPLLELDQGFDRALDSLWIAFQPIVTRDGRVYGQEAFIRSDHAPLTPAALIEASEQLDRVLDLGHRTRILIADTITRHLPFDHLVFVNLHPHDLVDDDLFDVSAPLSAHAAIVVLEVTERTSLSEVPDLSERIQRLRQMGFRLAIDDLGAGFAGLGSFTALEPDIAKLDMGLVRNVEQSLSQRRFISGLTKMCHELGILVVAEGVETEAERDILLDLGCDLLQGYHFARPSRTFPIPTW